MPKSKLLMVTFLVGFVKCSPYITDILDLHVGSRAAEVECCDLNRPDERRTSGSGKVCVEDVDESVG